MIEKIKYVEDNWDRFEELLRYFLITYDEIIKSDKEPRFTIETCPIMIRVTTIDPYEDSEYFIGIDRAYGGKGLSLKNTISKIKEVLTNPEIKKVFLKKRGDGYDDCFNRHDGIIKVGYSLSYHNSRAGMVFGLSHIYYGK